MSERQLPESTRTQQLKAAYDILCNQGTCFGGWWHPNSNPNLELDLCIEGALQVATGTVPLRRLNKLPIYHFVLGEARELIQERMAKLSNVSSLRKFTESMYGLHGRIIELDLLTNVKSYHSGELNQINDRLGNLLIFPLMERCIAKSEALDRQESTALLEAVLA